MKKYWPLLVVPAAAIVLLAVCWQGLPAQLASHFDAQGNATSTMSRNVLLVFPVAAFLLELIPLLFRRSRLRVLASVLLGLVVLSSMCVTLTCGRQPVFMYLEPVLLVGAVVCIWASHEWDVKRDRPQNTSGALDSFTSHS